MAKETMPTITVVSSKAAGSFISVNQEEESMLMGMQRYL